jgi:hypothetical protein
MIGHDGLGYYLSETEPRLAALLYHPQRPCANPGRGLMMNKQQAIQMKYEARTGSWLTD